MTDRRRFAPATERNRAPILEVLRQVLPPTGLVLEIASGSGEHAVFFGAALPHLTFQPTDISEEALESVRAWIEVSDVTNVQPPLALDTTETTWPVRRADALLCSNMIHIAPWAAAEGLFRGAERVLPHGAPLILYGPFQIGGRHTAPSNADFDQSLRRRNPGWGVRNLEDVQSLAASRGFSLEARHALPANNLALVFRRSG